MGLCNSEPTERSILLLRESVQHSLCFSFRRYDVSFLCHACALIWKCRERFRSDDFEQTVAELQMTILPEVKGEKGRDSEPCLRICIRFRTLREERKYGGAIDVLIQFANNFSKILNGRVLSFLMTLLQSKLWIFKCNKRRENIWQLRFKFFMQISEM